MDTCTDRRVEEVVLQKSAQIGGDEVLLNLCGFPIDQDPALILVVQPSLELVDEWSKAQLATMIRDTPCLQDKFAEPKSRDSGNQIREKRFPGGRITIAGANSARATRSSDVDHRLRRRRRLSGVRRSQERPDCPGSETRANA